ncbi:lipid-A-disaccharide synthase [Gammaproteobacteria bacterium]|nr:lipid-A-disaccharide synthase [Gammaproteobacteria bacterium]
MKIGIVAGEPSGDYLGAGLISALARRFPGMEFVGVGGPRMEQAGMNKLYEMERISIMGLDDLLQSLHGILKIRRSLFKIFSERPISIFIGIDVPDFNLGLERRLKDSGIPTVHYVSPTVWAWRGYRIRKIKLAVSHMLTLFPFEARYYEHHGVPVDFVGHPIADEIDDDYDKSNIRGLLNLPQEGHPVVALLPGSRLVELQRLGGLFIEVARTLQKRIEGIKFVAPFANPETRLYFEKLLKKYPDVPVVVVNGKSRQAMAAADVALLASGTAALEAALLRVPMVVAYKGSWASGALVKLLAHVEHFSMPNHLLENPIVPEFFQSDANVDNLVAAMSRYLLDAERCQAVSRSFGAIMSSLRCNANDRAAKAVANLIKNMETTSP